MTEPPANQAAGGVVEKPIAEPPTSNGKGSAAPRPPRREIQLTVTRALAIRLGGIAVAAAVLAWLAFELVSPSYDSLYSLAWGQVIADGVRPDVQEPLTPLAHPLPILLSSVLSVLGPKGAFDAYGVLAGFSFGFLCYAVYRLARALSPQRSSEALIGIGVLAVVLVATRVRLDYFAMKASLEIPFTALVLIALALVIESPRTRPWLPLALLVPAGLMRPDSWALGFAFCAWLAYGG